MSESFKPGDTVRLKSGSPLMTIEKITADRRGPLVWCVWFEKNKQHTGTFAPHALEAHDGTPTVA